jgi:hypothetical protein
MEIQCNKCNKILNELFYETNNKTTDYYKYCIQCKNKRKCIHNIRKSTCKECKGSSICSHNRIKTTCKECKGSSICSHNRIKSTCKECKGSSICSHNRVKSFCKDCKPCKCKYSSCDFISYKYSVNRHYKRFHTEKGIQQHKKKEQVIADLLTKNKINFKREYIVDYKNCDLGSNNSRIDFLIDLNGKLIFLEVDEDQHKSYNIKCEVSRMLKILESLTIGGNTINITFIRYNPDSYKVNDKIEKVLKKERENDLINILKDDNHLIYTINKSLAIYYMYYDKKDINDKYPLITYDIDYDETIKQCII